MSQVSQTLLMNQRKLFHRELLDEGVLGINAAGIASNADKGNVASCAIALGIAERLVTEVNERIAGQSSGATFEKALEVFIRNTFPKLQHIRPGEWTVMKLGNRSAVKTSRFAQYEHLEYLSELSRENKRLSTIIGNDYMVAPDIVVYRDLCTDAELNRPFAVVDEH
jgi:hypothetical protein